jgi:hypothetical protein
LGAQPPFSFAAGFNSHHGVVAPSPVKKKLSLGDYMSRLSNLATTPTIEKSQSQALESTPPAALSQDPPPKISPIAEETLAPPSATVKPNESFKQNALAIGASEGSAIADTLMKDEPVAETLIRPVSVPQFVPVMTNSSVSPTRPLANPPGIISPQVANVVSTLNAIMPLQASHRSHSTSSS